MKALICSSVRFLNYNMILGGIISVLLLFTISGCKSTTGADDPGEDPVDPPVEDTQPPSVSIISPTEGEEINREYIIQVNASDDNALESVTLYIDDEELGTLTSAPYEWAVTSTELYNGSYSLYASARDEAGNETTSDTITFDVLNYLFVLHLKDSWFEHEGIIQANNPDGSLIAQEEFSRSGTFYLHPPSKESVEEGSSQNFGEIDITFARNPINSENSSKLVGIRTYLNVEAWSEWTIGEDDNNYNLGYIQLEYTDASSFADHEGYIVSSNNGNSNSYTNQITEITDIWVWDQPGSQYFATDISNSPRYLKVEGLYDGNILEVDLNDFLTMNPHAISTPNSINAAQFIAYLYGRTTGSEAGSWLTYQNYLEMPGNTVELFYPADAFPEYETDILSTYDSDNGIHHYYTRGIPDEAKKLAGGITMLSSSVDNLEFNANSSDFDEFLITTVFAPAGGDTFVWYAYGPKDRDTITYPEMGSLFSSNYPSFDRNGFEISSIDISKYPNLQNGYRELNWLLYENGGQSFYDAITEFIRYFEVISNSNKSKKLLSEDIHELGKRTISSRYPKIR